MGIRSTSAVTALAVLLSACSQFAATNTESGPQDEGETTKATFNVSPARGRSDTLVVLSLSGGGSRAAYLSTSVMFRLEKVFDELNILQEVDAISSVSGGSLPAAYYAITTDPDPAAEPPYGRSWKESEVKELMGRNYIGRWFGNWFWPVNIGRFWFTAYDRTDIMAQTFADNLYDRKPGGEDLKIGDLLDDRPYLILNATDGTRGTFARSFTFTREEFEQLNSNINDYELSRAVMASATFPAVFNFMTLRNYDEDSKHEKPFTHVFDGGNFDNLGLKSVLRILKELTKQGVTYDRLVVILVDAYAESGGVSGTEYDPRSFYDFVVDTNFIDATDSLLKTNRDAGLKDFKKEFSAQQDARKSIFYHIQFQDVDPKYREKLNNIKTDFRIAPEDTMEIDKAMEQLLSPENSCLIGIRDLLTKGSHSADQLCTWSGGGE